VGETSGDRIVQRALGPLPDLNSIVFFRKGYRDFVIGRGPMPIRAGKKARAFMRGGMWLFLVTGVLTTLTVGAIELFRRQGGLDDLDAGYIIAGPLLLFLALVYWLFAWVQARRAAKEQRLSQGGLIGAELTGVRYFSGSTDTSTPSLRVDYRFTAPDGQVVDKRQTLPLFDFNRKNLPAVGSKLLILYVDKETFEVL
jgi:hypothetical protein